MLRTFPTVPKAPILSVMKPKSRENYKKLRSAKEMNCYRIEIIQSEVEKIT